MHAAILGVAMCLVGVQVGWKVEADRSVVYVIQLDSADLKRFQADGVIESDIPPQVKNVRQVRIELALPLSPPPVQQALPKEEPPRSPGSPPRSSPPSGASKRQTMRPSGDWLRPKNEGEEARGKPSTPGGKSDAGTKAGGPEKTGKEGEPPSQRPTASSAWLPLCVALCALLGANVYFFCMWMETRARWRRLLQRQRTADEGTKNQV